MITSRDIHTLAQRLHALMPAPLRRWGGTPPDPVERGRLADLMLIACKEAGLSGEHTGKAQSSVQAVIISEALAGFATQQGCRYSHLDDDVDRAQAALVTALGGVVHQLGVYQLAVGAPITVAAIAHLIAWVCLLEGTEEP
jgi:hypothetical protein